jgi:serine protease
MRRKQQYKSGKAALLFALTLGLSACGGGGTKNPVVPDSGGGSAGASQRNPGFITNVDSLGIVEGNVGAFLLRLSGPPGQTVEALVTRVSGDPDITVNNGGRATFNDTNYDRFQPIAMSAGNDVDAVNGRAVFSITAPGFNTSTVVVLEEDVDSSAGLLQLETSNASMELSEGATGTFQVRLNQQPAGNVALTAAVAEGARGIQVTSGNRLVFTPGNWNVFQAVSVTALTDVDACNENVPVSLSAVGVARSDVTVNVNDSQRTTTSGVSLCGIITVPVTAVVDGDVNDPNASYRSNDSLQAAQQLPNPVVVTGYVNTPGGGVAGRSRSNGDVSDFYAVDALAGQALTLFISDAQNADLDLYLYDTSGSQVDAATGVDATESLSIPQNGAYLAEVRVCNDPARCPANNAANYVLSLGQDLSPATARGPRLSDDFLPGEIIVRFKPVSTDRSLAAASTDLTSLGLSARSGTRDRPMLYQLDQPDAATPAGTQRSLAGGALVPHVASAEQALKLETLLALKPLLRRDDVASAEPNFYYRSLVVPNDTFYGIQWHYPQLNLPQAWDITTGDANVLVGVIDTGVLSGHPDLAGKFVDGYDFISSATNAGDGDGIDADAEDPGDQLTGGSSFHGSHVGGTIAATTDNGTGVAGVAWDARFMPLRALGRSGGSNYDVAQAMLYAAGLPNDSGTVPAQSVDVLNLSFGSPIFSQTTQDIVDQVRNEGVIVVAAAGNDGAATPSYPAAYSGVVSVGAVDINKNRAPYSNFGSLIDLMAPGGDATGDVNGDGVPDGILSTGGSDQTGVIEYRYPVFQGTSMAAPHAAGVIALMKSVNAALTPDDFDSLLVSGLITQDLGVAGRDDQFGYGLIDAQQAVAEAAALADLPPPVTPPTLVVQPQSVNLGAVLTRAPVEVTNAGDGVLSIQGVTTSDSWLTVNAVTTDSNGLGNYDVIVNRVGLGQGTYTGQVQFLSTAGQHTVQVLMQVLDGGAASDAGLHYVYLLEPVNHNVVAQANVQLINGEYRYSLANVPPGSYHLFATTNSNNDNQICDMGERCGAYGTLDAPSMVVVTDADRNNLDFSTGFTLAPSIRGGP